MNEISEELHQRKAVICVNCGSIFEDYKDTINIPCPRCGEDAVYWITPAHTWIAEVKLLRRMAVAARQR